jgi:hypothetical protein
MQVDMRVLTFDVPPQEASMHTLPKYADRYANGFATLYWVLTFDVPPQEASMVDTLPKDEYADRFANSYWALVFEAPS